MAVAVTLDPKFDTPPVLKSYSKANHLKPSEYKLATGLPEALETFASEFNVIGFPSEGTISHNLKTILIDPSMTAIEQFKDNEWKAKDVVDAISAHQKQKAEKPSKN